MKHGFTLVIPIVMVIATSFLWPAAAGQNVWTSYGPEGGTVTALALDPQTPTVLYAGIKDSRSQWSEGIPPEGRLYKTADGGRSWRATYTGLPNTEITGIFINPQTPTIIYVSVAGGRIFKSTDGGETWAGSGVTVSSVYPALSIAKIAFDPQTQTTIYAAGGNSIVKSTDGGSTWRTLRAGLPDDVGVSSIAIDPKTPTTLYIGLSSFRPARIRGIFKSGDGGETWRRAGLTEAAVVALAIDPQVSATLYAGTDGDSVFKSTDGGDTWRPSREGLSIENVYALAIDPQKPMTLYAGFAGAWGVHGAPGGRGVFKSIDGGVTWRALDPDPANSVVSALIIDPHSPATLYMGTEITGIFKSTDGGVSWRAVNSGLPSLGIVPRAIDPQRPNVVYSLAAGVFKSTDGGGTWRAINMGLGTLRMTGFVVDPKTPSTLYVGSHGSGLFKSTDGGMRWRAIGTDLKIWYYVTFALDPQTPTTVYASGLSSEDNCGGGVPMFKSTDGGENWRALHVGGGGCMALSLVIDPKSPTTLYMVISGKGIFKSTDGAMTWRETNVGLVRDEKSQAGSQIYVRGLKIDPNTPTTLYAFQSGGVFKSTDGGDTWRLHGDLSNLKAFSLAIDPQTTTTIYAGTSGSGVFKSTDGGESWRPLNMGLTDLVVWGVAIDPKTPTTIYASTVGGVFVLDQR